MGHTAMPHCDIKQIVYLSAASAEFTDDELAGLLLVARSRNTDLAITGLLLFGDGSFLQVLEGPPVAVDALYKDICQDDRHGGLVEVSSAMVDDRAFGRWSMGFVRTDEASHQSLDGFQDLRRDILSRVGFQGENGIALKMINAFLERIPAAHTL